MYAIRSYYGQASGAEEIRACQRLRYAVFYTELGAKPDAQTLKTGTDTDAFDAICDHLVVIHRNGSSSEDAIRLADGELIGTYRLLRQETAEAHSGFYTQGEFDISPIIKSHPDLRFLA